jgi:hypothetical protein
VRFGHGMVGRRERILFHIALVTNSTLSVKTLFKQSKLPLFDGIISLSLVAGGYCSSINSELELVVGCSKP